MEVALVEADGIPEGCLISVRAGSTRRQAPVLPHQPCKLSFPKGVDLANPFKVDLLAPLGNATFEVSSAKEKYPFEVKSRYGGKSMHVTLRVREDTSKKISEENEFDELHSIRQSIGDNLAGLSAGGTPAQRHQAALDQRAYLDAHNLLPWVHTLLQDLIRDKPGCPWDHIDAASAHGRLKATGSPAPPPATAAAKQDLGQSKDAAKADEFLSGMVATRAEEELGTAVHDLLRQRALDALAKGGRDGSLHRLVRRETHKDLRQRAVESLQASVDDGCLHSAVRIAQDLPGAGRVDRVRVNPGSSLTSPLHGGGGATSRLIDAASKSVASSTCEMARMVLLRAASDGRLDSALKEVSPKASQCQDAKEALLKAAQSGPVDAAFASRKAKDVLVQAAQSGKLDDALADATITKAKEVLLQAAQSPVDVGLQRQIARENMLKAARDGSLVVALREIAQNVPVKTQQALLPFAGYYRSTILLGACQAETLARKLFPAARRIRKKNTAERLFDKIDYKGDGIIDREELEYAIAHRIIKRPPGFVTSQEEADAALEQRAARFRKLASVGSWCRPLTQRQQVDTLRLQAKDQMVACLQNGRLMASSNEIQPPSPSSEADALELDALRNRANKAVASAVLSGPTALALRQRCLLAESRLMSPEPMDVQELRFRVRHALDPEFPSEAVDALRESAAKAAASAVLSGPGMVCLRQRCLLAERVWSPETVDVQELRFRTRNALEPEKAEALDIEVLRSRAGDILASAALSGKLPQVQKVAACGCGNAYMDDAIFCRKCGTKRPQEAPSPAQLRSVVAPPWEPSSPPASVEPARFENFAPMGSPSRSPMNARLNRSSSSGSGPRRSPPSSKANLPPLSPLVSTGSKGFVVDDARLRQEKVKAENDSLRHENARLKKMRESGDAANTLCNQNDQLRHELGKLLTLHKKDGPGAFKKGSSSTGRL